MGIGPFLRVAGGDFLRGRWGSVASQVPKIGPACDAGKHRRPISVAGWRKNEDLRRKSRAPATESVCICDTSALDLRHQTVQKVVSQNNRGTLTEKIPEIAASSLVRGSGAASP